MWITWCITHFSPVLQMFSNFLSVHNFRVSVYKILGFSGILSYFVQFVHRRFSSYCSLRDQQHASRCT